MSVPSSAHLLLHLGEMTAQEMRTAKAAYALAIVEITNPRQYHPKLDEWDFKAIALMKRGAVLAENVSKQHFTDLWSERCGFPIAKLEYMARRFLDLNEYYKWFSAGQLITDLSPNWLGSPMYTIYGNVTDFWDNTFSAIASILRLTEVVKIPGFREWIDKQKEN